MQTLKSSPTSCHSFTDKKEKFSACPDKGSPPNFVSVKFPSLKTKLT